MGTIRLLLAVSVLITHSAAVFGIKFLNGDMAVTNFFVISGFLMAMVLDKAYGAVAPFYLNRVLRVYPAYLAALLFSIVVFFLYRQSVHSPWDTLKEFHGAGSAVAFCVVTNLTILGQDIARYVSVNENGMIFPNFQSGPGGGAFRCMFVPQGWTLSLEIWFYVLVPFIRHARTVVLAFVAVGLFFIDYKLSNILRQMDTLAFFPTTFRFFLLGMLAYRGYKFGRTWLDNPPGIAPLRCCIVILGMLASVSLVVWGRDLSVWVDGMKVLDPFVRNSAYYTLFALSLPFAFVAGNWLKMDELIGEFSYPIYLFHYPIAKWAEATLAQSEVGVITLILTVAISAAYIYFFDRRIQLLRGRVRSNAGLGTAGI